MAYSYVRYTGNGSTKNYTFSFPFLDQSHIVVSVAGEVTTEFTFLNSSTIAFNTAPITGAYIEIRRSTPKDIPIINFQDGSVLLEKDLDLLVTFNLYVAQEADDGVREGLFTGLDFSFDANNKRISNMANPVNPQDASTKYYVDSSTALSVANAAASAAASLVSQNAAKVSETNSKSSEVASKVSENASKASELAAASSASYAQAQTTDPNLVLVAQDLAQGGVSNISDLGSIDEPATSSGIGTSYIKIVRDNITSIQNATANAATATAQAVIATSKAVAAALSESNAATSATNAVASATASANSASTASTQANNSSLSSASANTSAATATTKASEASASASAAAGSATASANSATTSETHKVAAQAAQAIAEAARDQTLTAYDQFDDRYLGNKASDPALDNDGNAIVGGSLYFNSVSGSMKLYTGTAWVNAYVSGGGFATTSTTVSAGSGLTGGGDLSANRTIGIATGGVTASMLASTLDLGTI